MYGSTRVDFAGTLAEAKAFAAAHLEKFLRTFAVWTGGQYSPNGDPILVASWRNADSRSMVRRELENLGWDRESQAEVQYGKRKT